MQKPTYRIFRLSKQYLKKLMKNMIDAKCVMIHYYSYSPFHRNINYVKKFVGDFLYTNLIKMYVVVYCLAVPLVLLCKSKRF